ncbi:hypothetical protein [Foetidibacter luteolus]|uniref:hypothetical protein n=1 Tax=Foetidibacter luteolus TaxID=2608880 RepID=UPI00129B6DBA|nr:hypothetical protein [Foetidibacter luteolus]
MDLQKFIEIDETKESIIAKLEYLKREGLHDYLQFGIFEMGLKRLPTKKSDQILEQIIAKSPNDLNVKVKNAEHYKAHLCCIKHVLEEMFLNEPFLENLRKYKVEEEKDMVVYNYYNLLREILFDMALLIQDYNQTIKGVAPTKFSLGKNLYQRDFTLYQLLPQVIFGQASFHSFIEREPNVSIAIIRQVIELRIRKAFGIMGTYDKVKDSFEPLPLGQVFDEIKKHQKEIDFAIPLANIVRINGWSNIFMHSGMKDYTWTLIFVYRYLHEFAKGRKDGKSWSSNSGIRLKQETLDKIVNGLEQTLKSYNANLELFKTKPDVYITT